MLCFYFCVGFELGYACMLDGFYVGYVYICWLVFVGVVCILGGC